MGKPGVKKVKKQYVPVPREKPVSQNPNEGFTKIAKLPWPPKLPNPRTRGSGNIFHGKPKYDPVYPRIKIPQSLKSSYPLTWRNGGRCLLLFTMAAIEGVRHIWTAKLAWKWQQQGYCEPRCAMACGKSFWRPLCAWRAASAGFHEHIIRMDALINSDKSALHFQRPESFVPPRGEVRRNTTTSAEMQWDRNKMCYLPVYPDDPAHEIDRIFVPISPAEPNPSSLHVP